LLNERKDRRPKMERKKKADEGRGENWFEETLMWKDRKALRFVQPGYAIRNLEKSKKHDECGGAEKKREGKE